MELDELARKINTSQIFALEKESYLTQYQTAKYELIENIYLYLQSLSGHYNDMGLEIVETVNQCLKSFDSDKGEFLNYFMSAIKRCYSKASAENIEACKRGGIHLSKSEQYFIVKLNCLARYLHCTTSENSFVQRASQILSISENEIQKILLLNHNAATTDSSADNEDTIGILNSLPAKDNVELEIMNLDTISTFLDCVEQRFQNSQRRQQLIISPLLSAKILATYPEVIEHINSSHTFFDRQILHTYLVKGYVPTARDISRTLGKTEASTSRSLKSFLREVRKLMNY